MFSLLTTLALAGAPAFAAPIVITPAADKATATPAKPKAARITVDATGLIGPEADYIVDQTKARVRDDGTKALANEHRVTVVTGADSPEIHVALSWVNHDESIYGVTITTRRKGEAARALSTFECECLDADLSREVQARLGDALAQLAPAPDPKDASAEPDGSTPVDITGPEESPHTDKSKSQKGAAIGPVGVVGIVAAVGGLGMTGYGASLITKGVDTEMDGERRDIERDHRVAGRAWLGTGVALAAVGITMMVVDLTTLRKKRQRRALAAPTVGASMLGVQVSGRF